MNRIPLALITLLTSALLLSCDQTEQEQQSDTVTPQSEQTESKSATQDRNDSLDEKIKKLHTIYAEFNEELLRLNPVIATFRGDMRFNDEWGDNPSPESLRKQKAFHQKYYDTITSIDPEGLPDDERLSYDVFLYGRQVALEEFEKGFAEMAALVPINQFYSVPNLLVMLCNGSSTLLFNTFNDYKNWVSRARGFVGWVEQAIKNMNRGIKQGVVQPRILMEKVLPQLESQIVENAQDSTLYLPIKNMPARFSPEEKQELTATYQQLIEKELVPAFKKLHDYIKDDYLPHAREEVGLAALPNGKAWYEYLARANTTTELTPDEIHRLGRQEAERIFEEMKQIKEKVGFKGDMPAFFEYLRTDPKFFFDKKEDLLAGYEKLRDKINPQLDKLFDVQPKADYEIRPVEAFREKSQATASYFPPSPDGTRPGVFYVNTYDLKARPKYGMEALSLHEASPGHHFQLTIAQELENLPDFRRFNRVTAYIEGWGLYAESLGEELGLYKDPYQKLGMLYFNIWRANRLVVDTGMHYKGWSREQAIDWMTSNSPITKSDVVAEVERYIAIPGQALAYKIGQLKLDELKSRARKALGEKFDIREFHNQVLTDGPLPLKVLEQKIDRWIQDKKAS